MHRIIALWIVDDIYNLRVALSYVDIANNERKVCD
jgi:hypothetical protein